MYCHRSLLTLPIGASLVVDCPRVPSTFSSLALEARTHCLALCLSLFLSLLFLKSYFNILVSGKKLCLLNIFYCVSEFWNNGSKPRVAINTVRCTKSVEHPFLGLSKTNRYNQLHFQVHLYCRQTIHTKCTYRDTRTVYFCKSTKQYVGTRVGIDCILVHFVHFCKSMKRYVGTIVGIDCILPPLLSLI